MTERKAQVHLSAADLRILASALDSLVYELCSYLGDGLEDDDLRMGQIEQARQLIVCLRVHLDALQSAVLYRGRA